MQRIAVLALFFLSGVCGLVYEVVWARELTRVLGVTVHATATVLAAYMAGLALGSFAFGRRIDRARNPVRVYAWLELAIGICGLSIPFAFALARALFASVGDAFGERFVLLSAFRSGIALCVLLVPTFLMGGTVPAIARYLVERRESVGWNVGLLYALNTLGGAAGVVATGFVLVPYLGLGATTALAAAGNFAIAAVLLLARVGEGESARTAQPSEPAPAAFARNARLAGVVFAASGFAALAYEVVWTRVLVVHVHNSSYAFSTMLAVFLAGLVLGDLLMLRFVDRLARPLGWLGGVQVALGISVVVAAAVYAPLGALGRIATGAAGLDSWRASVAEMFFQAALVMLPFTALLGTTFALVARVVCGDVRTAGRALANVYAANTCGAIVGALASAFVLIPWLGLRGTLLFLSALNVLLGAACWLTEARRPELRLALAAVVLAALVLPHLAIPQHLFQGAFGDASRKLIFYREGASDTTGIWEAVPSGHRVVFYGDQRGTAGTNTNSLNRTQGHLAHLLHPRPTASLQIGFGVGNTLGAASLHPEVQRLDCVELSPHVRETAPFFWTNGGVLDDPKVRLVVEDGRNYLLRTRERYQVITLEPPNVYTAGVVDLYTREFYALASAALTDDGLLSQWIAAVDHEDEDVRSMVRAVAEVFPEVTVWDMGPLDEFGIDAPTGFLLVIAAKQPLRIDPRELARRMDAEPVRADLQKIGFARPARLLSLFVAGNAGVRAWTEGATPVTDDFTRVDYASARSVYSGFGRGFAALGGAQARAWLGRLAGVGRLEQRLRQPIEPLLV
ncbi:MAG TPA: fused MFS/spermidine synthase, partial [Myxococcota bacterium]|nr:fused MFS/spermidine synthase [Myxococcota bacterium]